MCTLRRAAPARRALAPLALALWVGAGCAPGGPRPEPTAFSAEAQSLVVRLTEVGFQRFAGEGLEFEVLARKGIFQPERRIAELDDVKTFFRDTERGEVRLSAERGEFDLEKRNFVMRGAVEGTTPSGEHFSTSEARYDRAVDRIIVDQPVTLESGRVTSHGSGLVFDLASRELTLFDIQGQRAPERPSGSRAGAEAQPGAGSEIR